MAGPAAASPDGGSVAAAAAKSSLNGSPSPSIGPDDVCPAGISPESTQRIFNAVSKAAPTKSQCTFEGVTTNRQTLDVRWAVAGKQQSPMTVEIRECMKPPPPGKGPFVITVPPALVEQCPDWKAFEAQFRSAVDSEAPLTFSTGGHDAPKWRRYAIIALLLAAGAGVIALRRRPSGGGAT
jgi:hypothetical protein